MGIGTATPTAYLHVKGTGAGGGSLLAEGLFKEKQDAPPVIGAGTRMMWYSDKAAFRVGEVMGTNWDKDSIGNHSVAMGYDTRAKGIASIAIGNANKATGDYSLAMGAVSVASGTRSVAIGAGNTASNNWSTAIGSYNNATGINASAMGYMNTAEGSFSMALGENTTAHSGSELVVGRFNSSYTPLSKTGWNNADRLFVIGNGAVDVPHNAMTVLKNGMTGIGTDIPKALLHVNGTATGDGNVLFTGNYKETSPGDPPASGAGTRMMWYPDKGALRAGSVWGTEWDKDNIGNFSVALGRGAKASGPYSLAFGNGAIASNWYSIVIGGIDSQASGNGAVVLGGGIASAKVSTAIRGKASGIWSKAIGGKAESYYSTSMGYNNVGGGSPDSWIETDPLFEIGNSNDEKKPHNALTILKNGNMTVGGKLRVEGIISNKGDMTVEGDLRVEGNISSKGEKKTEVAVAVNTTINAGSTTSISITFPKAYSAAPAVYVGNVTTGGGFAEVIMSVAQVTTTGGKLFIFNPKSSSQSPNYTVKIIALGAE